MFKRLIYALIDPRDSKIRYIGLSSVGIKRPESHIKMARRGRSPAGNEHEDRWLAQLVAKNIEPTIWIIQEGFESDQELGDAETRWLRYYKNMGMPLTNIKEGGWGGAHSDKTREKIRLSCKGKTVSEKTRKKLSEANTGENNPQYGKPHSKETRKKLSVANTGKIFSEETRRKMSIAKIGKNNPQYGKSLSEETCKKMSIAHTGKTLSKETRTKMSNTRLGTTHSPETRAKISIARRKNNK